MNLNNKRKLICLIHSDQDINDLFKTFLEYSGYYVDGYTNPSDALSSLRKDKIWFCVDWCSGRWMALLYTRD